MRMALSVLCGLAAGMFALSPVAASAQDMSAAEKTLYEAAVCAVYQVSSPSFFAAS